MSIDDKPAVERFEDDLHELINRYRRAVALTLAEAVGTLHVVAAMLIRQETEDDE